MNILQISLFVLVGLAGGAVVLTRDPLAQTLLFTVYGLVLSLLLLALQAPDVALSELVIGAVVYPLMVMLTLTKLAGAGNT